MVIVTDRKLLDIPLEQALDKFLKAQGSKVEFIVLREKDLDEEEYIRLFKKVKKVVNRYGIDLYTNTYIIENTPCHLPYFVFEKMKEILPEKFGVSTHSLEEAEKAQKAGASYIFFGNVYETTCKRGLGGRGIKALETICKSVSIPVYAIGGMNEERGKEAIYRGAKGIAVRSLITRYL